jgi:hypothetical protein
MKHDPASLQESHLHAQRGIVHLQSTQEENRCTSLDRDALIAVDGRGFTRGDGRE